MFKFFALFLAIILQYNKIINLYKIENKSKFIKNEAK